MTVESLGKHTNNAKFMSPEDTLKDALEQLKEGGDLHGFTKLAVIGVDDRDDRYAIDWRQCGMKQSEFLALLEAAKMLVLNNMGYNSLDW